jgi:phosphoribosyl-ATP pyrophosphohydrolase/phosphoribosyl-AMP cyclohydrolase
MAQKVGEEGVEVALAAATQDDDRLVGESADLLFHLTLLLKSRGLSLTRVIGELERRHRSKP